MVEVDGFNRAGRVRAAALTLVAPAILGAAAYAIARSSF
jgi:hypothetical protein